MDLPQYITDLLDGIALKEGFSNYKFETEPGSKHGENFLGQVTAIKLTGDREKCGEIFTETLHLMCKTTATNKHQINAFRLMHAFEREVFIYSRVLPLFAEFQREKGLSADESFLSYPKVYATLVDKANERCALIMEDLRPKHFVMWPRQEPVTLEHEKLIMTLMGRFHGISFALKDQRPEIFVEFEALDDIFLEMMTNGHANNMFGHSIERAIEVSENENHRNVLKKLQQNYYELYKSFFSKETIGKWGIVNHGDCWINNVLFQYGDNVSVVALFRIRKTFFRSKFFICRRRNRKMLASSIGKWPDTLLPQSIYIIISLPRPQSNCVTKATTIC